MSSRPPGLTSIPQVQALLGVIADWMYSFALIVGVIMFLWGGFLYYTSADNPEQLEKAKKTLLFGVIGLVVAIIASDIPTVITNFLGV